MLGPMPYWNYVDWTPRWDRGVPPAADAGHSTDDQPALRLRARSAPRSSRRSWGRVLQVPTIVRALKRFARAVRARAWDSVRGLFRDAPDTSAFSQQTNVLAVLADAVPTAAQRR